MAVLNRGLTIPKYAGVTPSHIYAGSAHVWPQEPSYLVPMTSTAATPDPGPLPPKYTFVCTVIGPTAATQTIASQSENHATDRAFMLSRRNTDGGITYNTYRDGTTGTATGRTNQVAPVTSTPQTLGIAITADNGTGVGVMDTYRYENGAWVLHATGSPPAPYTSKDSSQVVRIGGVSAASGRWDGRIYLCELRTGLDPSGVAPAGAQVVFPGDGTSYLEPAFSPAYNITGDIEWVFRARLPGSTADPQVFQLHRWFSSAPYTSQRSWWISCVAGNRLRVSMSFAGLTTDTAPQTNTFTFPGVMEWYKITRNATTGETLFYRAADQPFEPTVWTSITTPYVPVPGALYAAPTAPLSMGSSTSSGRLARFIVRNGIGAAAPVAFDFNETDIPNNAVTSFTATSGQAVTVTGNPFGANIPSQLLWRFDAAEHVSGTSWTDTRGRVWTVTNAAAIVHPQGRIAGTAHLDGSVPAAATAPDPGVPPDPFIIVAKIRGPATGTTGNFASQWGASGLFSWRISRSGTSAQSVLVSSPDGIAAHPNMVLNFPAPTGNDEWVAYGFDRTSGTVYGYTSTNGTTWTPTSDTPKVYGGPLALFDTTMVLRIGSHGNAGTINQFIGRIYSCEMRTGIDPVAGTVVWRFDSSEVMPGATTHTDPRGTVWTLAPGALVREYP